MRGAGCRGWGPASARARVHGLAGGGGAGVDAQQGGAGSKTSLTGLWRLSPRGLLVLARAPRRPHRAAHYPAQTRQLSTCVAGLLSARALAGGLAAPKPYSRLPQTVYLQ